MKTQRIVLLVAMACLLLAAPAHAIDGCKVKVDKKTGVLAVSATGVVGTLLWGSDAATATQTFFNAGTCVASGKANNCQIADPATLEAKTPPSGCTLYLNDGTTPCSVWIAGCTPGGRNTGVCAPNSSASPRWVDNGDGTVSDKATCLMWEKKTGPVTGYNVCPGGLTCGDVHDVNNAYALSTDSPYNPDGDSPYNPDGPAFFDFLADLNGPIPFAGHDDWRLPTITELNGIVVAGPAPTIDPVFGPTRSDSYWSSSTYQFYPANAWYVFFSDGYTGANHKTNSLGVRAVRAGS